mmetsp:Transcript_21705/g.33433  ORF Transcript_21705/g.33433 Transcript_21705/m.33433 type:complete len:96 (-) Transcript_21705:1179-1466(-)
MALGSITEGPDKQEFSTIILQSFQNLLAMFQDQNGKVREAISWVMSRICENHADTLLSVNNLEPFLKSTLEGVKDKPRISNQCCGALEKLALSAQ